MKLRLSRILFAVSSLLCACAAAIGIRSYWRADGLSIGSVWAITTRGELFVGRSVLPYPDAGPVRLTSFHEDAQQVAEHLETLHENGRWVADRNGFGLHQWRGQVDTGGWGLSVADTQIVAVPSFLLAAIASLPAWRWSFVLWRRRSRRVGGFCPACGYDIRFSNGRCPECGLAA